MRQKSLKHLLPNSADSRFHAAAATAAGRRQRRKRRGRRVHDSAVRRLFQHSQSLFQSLNCSLFSLVHLFRRRRLPVTWIIWRSSFYGAAMGLLSRMSVPSRRCCRRGSVDFRVLMVHWEEHRETVFFSVDDASVGSEWGGRPAHPVARAQLRHAVARVYVHCEHVELDRVLAV